MESYILEGGKRHALFTYKEVVTMILSSGLCSTCMLRI
jgi:hypothetical protein